jgi:hypothetical protein
MPSNSTTSAPEIQHQDIPGFPGYKARSDGEVYEVHHPGNPAGVEYRDIADFPGCRVGDDGSVWSRRRGGPHPGLTNTWRELAQSTDSCGRKSVRLQKDGRQFNRRVHRLVLEAFDGPCPEGEECRHFPDRDPGNNRRDNLVWGTSQQNKADMVVHGTALRGEQNGYSRLSAAEVQDIRRRSAAGWSQYQLARQFGVHQTTIGLIIRLGRWAWLEDESRQGESDKDIPPPPPTRTGRGESNPNAKFSTADILEIRRLAAAGWPQRQIGARFGVSQGTIGLIVRRKRWAWLEDAPEFSPGARS